MNCLNRKCGAELPEYRVSRQNQNITKWWFCKQCSQYGGPKNIRRTLYDYNSESMYSHEGPVEFKNKIMSSYKLLKSNTYYGLSKEPFEWECFRADCQNVIKDTTARRHKYCCDLCKRRDHLKTAVKTYRNCEECGLQFFPRRFGTQKLCGVRCHGLRTNRRRREERS